MTAFAVRLGAPWIRSRGRRVSAAVAAPPGLAGRSIAAVCAALLVAEALGTVLLWAPLPFAWMWVGGRIYALTGSLFADGMCALTGFALSAALMMRALARVDAVWIRWRRRGGHDQRQGALTQVVVVSATLGLAGFAVWYYLLSHAFILPFMPSS